MAQLLIVTGLSGSGKSTALNALEDAGFFCMDNLPLVLLPKVVELGAQDGESRLAVGVDVRDARHLPKAEQVIEELRTLDIALDVLFLDADDDTLVKRFQETRRRHPVDAGGGDIRAAIQTERNMLTAMRALATSRVDTSALSVHELKRVVQDHYAKGEAQPMSVKMLAFGFKHGLPSECDLVFDVRFLKNPHFIPELRPMNGTDPLVAGYVLEQDGAREFLGKVTDLLGFLLPRYQAEGKAYLTIGIGCTGGKHRSVAIAESIARRIGGLGVAVVTQHRDSRHW